MGKYSNIEGARDVNGSITPTTLQPIEHVESDDWSTMTASELLEQRSILYSRLDIATQYSTSMVPMIRRGINELDALIDQAMSENNSGIL